MDKYAEKNYFKQMQQAYNEALRSWHILQQQGANNLELLMAEHEMVESQKKLTVAEDNLISWLSRNIRSQHQNDPRLQWLENIPTLIQNQSFRKHLIKTAQDYNPN
ncbi:MAG: hypothetical protein ACK5LE_06790 [Alphaproteobacteria bacterium]